MTWSSLPLNAAQYGVWAGQQLEPDSWAQNIAEYIDIRGPLDPDRFVAALLRTADECDALNVRVDVDETGQPRQVRHPHGITVPVHDVRAEVDPEAAAWAIMTAQLRQVVDPAGQPLAAHALLRLGDERWWWYHQVHHLALDGYGMGLFAQRLAARYSAAAAGRGPEAGAGEESAAGGVAPLDAADISGETHFGDYAAAIADDRAYAESVQHDLDRQFWLDHNAGKPDPVSLAGGFFPLPTEVHRAKGDLPPELFERLQEFAQTRRLTWVEAFYGAFAAYLHRYTGSEVVCLAIPVMLRMAEVVVNVPNMNLNAVQLHTTCSPATSYADLAVALARHLARSRKHHRFRYEELRRDLGLLGTERRLFGPSVNVMPFDYNLRFGGSPGVAHNVSAGLVEDLALHVYARGDRLGIRLILDANPNAYQHGVTQRHLERFLAFLGVLLERPEEPVSELPLIGAAEQQLLQEWGRGGELAVDETSIVELLERVTAASPEATALVASDATLTYADLVARARVLAGALVARGVRPQDRVALLLPRDIRLVVAMFAVQVRRSGVPAAGPGLSGSPPGVPTRRLRSRGRAGQRGPRGPTATRDGRCGYRRGDGGCARGRAGPSRPCHPRHPGPHLHLRLDR